MTLKRSPDFCLKFINRYLLKAGHLPGDTRSDQFWPYGHNFNKLGKGSLSDATYKISRL